MGITYPRPGNPSVSVSGAGTDPGTIAAAYGTAAEWAAANPILLKGEIGYETDTGTLKAGDGATAWSSLAGTYGLTAAAPNGTNDTTTLQASITAASTLGVSLWLVKGATYKVSASLTLPSNFVLDGQGALITANAATNAAILVNSDRSSSGNSNITVRNVRLDGGRSNQTLEFSVIDFKYVTDSIIDGCDVQGGRRNNTYPNGTDGECIVFRYGGRNKVTGCYLHDTDYDGMKLRSSTYNTITGNVMKDCGRSGVQVSFQSQNSVAPFNDVEGQDAYASKYNTVIGNTIQHTTGTPATAAPTTSGVYMHTASHNVISQNTIFGVRQGIGVYASSNDNAFNGNVIRWRYTDRAALDEEGGGTNDRNVFEGNTVVAESGATPMSARTTTGSSNVFLGNRYSVGSGASGSPTHSIAGTANRFIYEAGALFTDGGTNSTIIASLAGTANALVFGGALDTQISRTAASVLSLGSDDVLKTGQSVTGSRPAAATVGKGAQFYDTTLNKPVWSDGTNWKDAAGTTV